MANRFMLSTSELCLSYPYSQRTLFRLRQEGILTPGVHFIVKSLGTIKPALLWDPVAVEEVLAKRTRKVMKR